MHRQFQALGVNGKVLAALPGSLGGDRHAFGQQIADAFAVGHHANQFLNGVIVAPKRAAFFQVHFFRGDNSFFHAFEKPADDHAGGNGIQTQHVAQVIGDGHAFGAVVKQVGAQRPNGFVFRLSSLNAAVDTLANFNFLRAGDRAHEAGMYAALHGLGIGLPGDFLRAFRPDAFGEVFDR